MTYLISQILICLFFTAVIGVIVGWLLRGVSAREDIHRLAAGLEDRSAPAPGPETEIKPGFAPPDDAGNRHRLSAVETVAREQARRLAQKAGQIAALENDVAKLKNQTANPDARVNELRTQLAAAQRAMAGLRSSVAERDARLARLAENKKKDRGVTAAATTAAATAVTADAPPPGREPPGLLKDRPERVDPLQEITGIGPVLERVLNRLGIYHYRQIARLTPDNIDWVATHLDWFPGRILRENWVQQAARLHRLRYPDEPL